MVTTVEKPLGFPRCPECYWLKAGSASVCFGCASKTMTPLSATPCPVCSQATALGLCSNRLCSDPERTIDRIDAIAVYGGELRQRILRYKQSNRIGWATVFGRIVLGHLEAHYQPSMFDLIIANPTHPTRVPRHTELVIERAATEDLFDEWPLDTTEPRALIKTSITPGSGGAGATLDEKRAAAGAVRAALHITDPGRIAGKRVLIYDDICTSGYQLNAVASMLRDAGAVQVSGVVLARTSWGA